MPKFHGPKHRFQKVLLSAFQFRYLRTQGREQRRIDGAPFLQSKYIHAQRAFQKILMCLNNIRLAPEVSDASIRGGEKMIMNRSGRIRAEYQLENILFARINLRSEIVRRLQWHVAPS